MYQVPIGSDESWLRARLRRHVGELLRLAAPVVVARAGIIVMALVDTIFVGRFGSEDLAHLTIGGAIFHPILGTAIGLVLGTMVMSANALGRGRRADAGAALQRGVVYGGVIGIAGMSLALFAEPALRLTGQEAAVAAAGADVALILAYGLPATIIYVAMEGFLEGIKRPLPGMVVMILANIVNVFANWILVFGYLGLPALGAEGAAWASTISRTFLLLALGLYILRMSDRALYGVTSWPGWRWRDWSLQRRIGYGAGASIGIESSAFAILTIFAGWLGALELASYGIGLNLLALIFMVSLGFGSATAVRVGIAHGRRDLRDLVLAGWTGLGVNSLVMALLGIVLWVWAEPIAWIYTVDPELHAITVPIIRISAFILIVDGGQVVMSHALRGRGDATVPAISHLVSYLLILVPLGWLVGVHLAGDVYGLFEAILFASLVSTLLLALRFHWLARRDAGAGG